MKITCFFAFNSSASSCLVVFESSSLRLSFNGTIHRSLNLSLSSTGLIDIPKEILQHEVLGIGVFDAKVYDASKDGTITGPALERKGALILQTDGEKPSDNTSFAGERHYYIHVHVYMPIMAVCLLC